MFVVVAVGVGPPLANAAAGKIDIDVSQIPKSAVPVSVVISTSGTATWAPVKINAITDDEYVVSSPEQPLLGKDHR